MNECVRFLIACLLGLSALLCNAPKLQAQQILESTYLVGMNQGSKLSDIVTQTGQGGYELSSGGYVDFKKWYAQKWVDMRVDFMTQITDEFGILWGLSTGEVGKKYSIDPGLKLGLIFQTSPTPNSALSFSVTTIVGGHLREKACTADYGDIGGIQQVNCRLAATELEPSATLKYLLNKRPPDHSWVGARYTLRF